MELNRLCNYHSRHSQIHASSPRLIRPLPLRCKMLSFFMATSLAIDLLAAESVDDLFQVCTTE